MLITIIQETVDVQAEIKMCQNYKNKRKGDGTLGVKNRLVYQATLASTVLQLTQFSVQGQSCRQHQPSQQHRQ